MKKIAKKEIQKLTLPDSLGRTPRCPKLYQDLKEIKNGEIMFISRDEWKKTGYSQSSFKSWMVIMKNQKRENHKSQFTDHNFQINSYKEGWTIKRVKAEIINQ